MKKSVTSFIFFIAIVVFSANAQTFTHKAIAEEVKYVTLLDSKDRLWYVNGENELYMYNGTTQPQNIFLPKKKCIMKEDENGTLWGISQTGIICNKNNEWKEYPYENDKLNGFSLVSITKDENNRIYFFYEKKIPGTEIITRKLVILEKNELTVISNNLPERIERGEQYKNGYVFGANFSYDNKQPCGYYNGEYKLLKEGEVYDFFNSMKSVMTQDWVVSDEIAKLYDKYNISRVNIYVHLYNQKTVLMLLTKNKVVCMFFKGEGYTIQKQEYTKTKEYAIPNAHLKLVDDIVDMYYLDDMVYLITFNEGIIKISESSSQLLTNKNGLASNDIEKTFLDKNKNLVLMHPKSSSVLMNGKWKYFDKDSGYDLNKRLIRYELGHNDNKYIVAYKITGKSNKLLRWDGSKWKTFDFKTKYRYTSSFEPIVYKNTIWLKNHNGNNYKGLIYFNRSEFIDYPLGKRLKQNWVNSAWSSEKVFYVHSSGMSGTGPIFKIK